MGDAKRATLSLSFKDAYGALITASAPTQTRLPPVFANLLPEGTLRDYLAQRAGVKAQREFYLAWVLGRDLPGAVQIVPQNEEALPRELQDSPLNDAIQDDEKAALRFSLAGMQLKFSAVQRATGGLTIPADGVGGSWIVKLPSTKFEGVPENEFAMMALARRIGIDVPETRLLPVRDIQGLPKGIELHGDRVFAIRRFDRAADGTRIHIEDFAQVFGVYPERKYERASYRNIARVVWIEVGETGLVELIRRLVFNALIGNADMHLKNWSFVHPVGDAPRLAPAYDFVSTISEAVRLYGSVLAGLLQLVRAIAHATASMSTAPPPLTHCGRRCRRGWTARAAAPTPTATPATKPATWATMSVVEAAMTSGRSSPVMPPVPVHPSSKAPAMSGPQRMGQRWDRRV